MARLIIQETSDDAVAALVSPAIVGIVGHGDQTTAVATPTEIESLDEAEAAFGGATEGSIYNAVAAAMVGGRTRVKYLVVRYATTDNDDGSTPSSSAEILENAVAAIRTLRTARFTGGHNCDIIIAAGLDDPQIVAELGATCNAIRGRAVIGGDYSNAAAAIAWQQTAGNRHSRVLKVFPDPKIAGITDDVPAEAVVAGFWGYYETLPNGRAITPSGRLLESILPGDIEVEWSADPTSDMSELANEGIMSLASSPNGIETFGGQFAGDSVLSHLAPRTVADYIYADLNTVQQAYTRRTETRANSYHINVLGARLQARLRFFARPAGSGLIEGGSVAVDNVYNNEEANLAAGKVAYDITLVMPRAWGDITFRVNSQF